MSKLLIRLFVVAAILTAYLPGAGICGNTPKIYKYIKPNAKIKDEIVIKPEPQTKAEIMKPLQLPATAYAQAGVVGKILSALSLKTPNGPLIPFPVLYSSKDLGISFGVMPILTLKEKSNQTGPEAVKAIIVPSLTYNKNLGATLSYRHYIFPTENSNVLVRASRSEHVEREAMIRDYTPAFLGTKIRLSAEARYWVTGKPSFYGIGPHSLKSDRANYGLHTTGEEVTAEIPVIGNFFAGIQHAFFSERISEGPLDNISQVKYRFPLIYAQANEPDKFMTHRFMLLYDDTDHPILPKLGFTANASVLYSNKRLGSDFEYRTYTFEGKHYYNYKNEGNFVTATHYLLQFQCGEDIPFYAMPQLGEGTGLRMAGDGRFVDRAKLVFNIEERITLSRAPLYKFISEFELAPFLDIGTVARKPSAFRGKDMKYGPGLSVRLLIRPQTAATINLAFGSEGINTLIKVGYPF